MALGMLTELKQFFVVQGLWAQEEENEHPMHATRNESTFQDRSVCVSTYERRGDGSVFADGEYNTIGKVGSTAFAKRSGPCAASFAQPRSGGPYRARAEDEIDIAVAEVFQKHPDALAMNHGFTRTSPGRYMLQGRQITIERKSVDLPAELTGDNGPLVVRDGPLTQPLVDYLTNTDSSAQYSGSVFQSKNALQTIPQDCRMTFCDSGAGYSRIEAMKVAKEQALTREKAAVMVNQGQNPADLVAKYDKMLDTKLGWKRSSEKNISFASSIGSVSNPIKSFQPQGGRRINFGTAAPQCAVRSPGALRPPIHAMSRPGHAQVPPRAGGA